MMGKMVGIEKDHRIISQILGKMWKRLSAEEKQPYIELAAQKKREHLERYPDYRFQPKPRTEQPKKRNVKRNTPADKQRFAHVADCLLQGKSGEEIVKEINTFQPEVEELDRERFNASPCFSDASRGGPSESSPASDNEQPFRSPLLPPATEGSVHLLPVPELSSFSMHASIFVSLIADVRTRPRELMLMMMCLQDARPYTPTPDAGITAVEQSMAAMGFRDPSPHDFGAVSAGVAVPEAALAPYPTASQPPAAIYVDAASYQYPTEAEMWFTVPEAFPQENASYDPMGMLPPPAQDNTCQWDYYGAQDMRQSQLPQLSQLSQPQALLPEQQTQMAMAFGYAQGIDNWTQPPVWIQ